MPSVLLVSEPLGNPDRRDVAFKGLIQKHLASAERALDNGAGRGGCPTATAVGAMRENGRASCLSTPESVVAGQRNDSIARTNGGQVGCGRVEAGVLPSLLSALHPEGFDHLGIVWS